MREVAPRTPLTTRVKQAVGKRFKSIKRSTVSDVRFGSKADIEATQTDVCFVPKADIETDAKHRVMFPFLADAAALSVEMHGTAYCFTRCLAGDSAQKYGEEL